MGNKAISVPCKAMFSQSNSDDLVKVTVKVYHNGLNLNKTFFDDEAFENSKDSFGYKPIVGNIICDDGDKEWGGHDLEEISRGVLVGDTHRTEYDEIEEKTYAIVDGYIWKYYSGDGYDLLKKKSETDVSMEIEPLEYYKGTDGYIHIKKFNLLCVTIIGSNPAMVGANIKFFSQATDEQMESFAKKFSVMIEKIKEITNKGGKIVDREEIISKFSYLKENEKYTEIINNAEMSNEDLEKALFELSANQKANSLREVLSTQTFIMTRWGETYEENKYRMEDVINDTVIVYCVEDRKYYGLPFTITGDKANIDFVNAKRYIRGDWREYQEGDIEPLDIVKLSEDKMQEMADKQIEKVKSSFVATETEEYKELNTKYEEVIAEKETLTTELEELRKFKAKSDAKARENAELELFSQYDEELCNVDSYNKLKENKADFSIEELEEKCLIEYGKFMKNNKKPNKNYSLDNSVGYGYKLDGESSNNEDFKGSSAWDILSRLK